MHRCLSLGLASALSLSPLGGCSRPEHARAVPAEPTGVTPDTQRAAAGGMAAPVSQPTPPDSASAPRTDSADFRTTSAATPANPVQRQVESRSRPRRDPALTPPEPTPPAPADTTKPGPGSEWLKWDPATRTVTFQLIAGADGAKSPFNFNGYTNGEATLTVPPGVTVVMNFLQKDGTPHSAELIADQDPMPSMAGSPAIPRAYTNKAAEGLPQEAKDVMRFTAPDSGSFRIFCGVPGHGLSGMWIRFKVDPAAKEPAFGPT